ncbi:unnamed protein product [Knipowitschia caucasica]
MSSYANDRLYNGYLRTNMPRIVTTVRPREIMVHLPCLTDHDRETIEAKRETYGSFDAMVRLLDCLKRRENWPEQFIAALEACEHRIIAAEIRAEYDALRGINNSSPPAARVVAAHIHPAPSASHLPDPEPEASPPPAVDVQSEAPVTQPIQETKGTAPQSAPEATVTEETTLPEPPQPQTEAAVVPPVTPPPSPNLAQRSVNDSPPPEQVDYVSHQEPEEDLEPAEDFPQESVHLCQEAEENTEIPQAPMIHVEPCEVDESSLRTDTLTEQPTLTSIVNESTPIIDPVKEPTVAEPEPATAPVEDRTNTTSTFEEAALSSTVEDNPVVPPAAVEALLGQSPSPMTNLDDLILTPEKPPVQETSPLEEKAPVLNTSEPEDTQVDEILQEIEAPPNGEVENGASNQISVPEEDDICFSKPGVLVSVEPPDPNNTTIRAPNPVSVYSGDSGRLEMSADVVPCQKNGIHLKVQQKEVTESLESDIQENIGHLTEDTSILNKEIPSLHVESIGLPIAASTLISDLSSTDVELCISPNLDIEKNVAVVEKSVVNETALLEDIQDLAIVINSPATTIISETTSCTNVEDISESLTQSLDMDDVREHTGHVAEDPSILNLVQPPVCQITSNVNVEQEADKPNVQTPLIQVNGEPAKELDSTPSICDFQKPSDPLVDPKEPDSAKTTRSLNSRYIMAAAGVGTCALLIAWRFKH